MSPSQQIGLLPPFAWIANQDWFGTSALSYLCTSVLVCWFITPFGHIAFAFITQAYVVPLSADKQFQSLFPGDLFLGLAVATLMTVAREMDSSTDRWFQSALFHYSVLVIALAGATVIWFVVERPNLTFTQWVSPSKLYHTYVLWGLYGYVGIVTFVAAVFGSSSHVKVIILAVVAASVWGYLGVKDIMLPAAEAAYKQSQAHPSSYRLLWLIPISPK